MLRGAQGGGPTVRRPTKSRLPGLRAPDTSSSDDSDSDACSDRPATCPTPNSPASAPNSPSTALMIDLGTSSAPETGRKGPKIQKGSVVAKLRRTFSADYPRAVAAAIPRPGSLAIRPTASTPAADLPAMLWSHLTASVDDISAEAATANRWAPHIAREARARLGAMSYHHNSIFEELRRLMPAQLNETNARAFGARMQQFINDHGHRPRPTAGDYAE